ncbi:hypothetical protein [Novosphingobium album (ex Liu et al. 2023)]|uniref:Uncharacterized protein n=1 Tax=Novosphingobium album (ex Liu et al. 2023) TaxID=3031130 RepID=A0ABT5WQD6_9SPHN|nr:hypothetical protein [Novosphingobium album (ex Liu et al. 2023)]MDE8652255.1 hypothetical protein [Novosphingobium album (ex Liu et al. 2023)]
MEHHPKEATVNLMEQALKELVDQGEMIAAGHVQWAIDILVKSERGITHCELSANEVEAILGGM